MFAGSLPYQCQRGCGIRIEFDGALEFALGAANPIEMFLTRPKGRVSLCEAIVDVRACMAAAFSFGPSFDAEDSRRRQQTIGIGKTPRRTSVMRILLHGLGEKSAAFLKSFLGPLVPIEEALQIELWLRHSRSGRFASSFISSPASRGRKRP